MTRACIATNAADWFEHNCDLTQTAKSIAYSCEYIALSYSAAIEDITHIKSMKDCKKYAFGFYIGMELEAESVPSDKLPLPGRIEIC